MAKQLDLSKFGFLSKDPAAEKKRKRLADQKKYEGKRQRIFQEKWIEDFPGLDFNEEENKMYCTVCVKQPLYCDKSSSFVTGCNTFRVGSLQSHWKSANHVMAGAANAPVSICSFVEEK